MGQKWKQSYYRRVQKRKNDGPQVETKLQWKDTEEYRREWMMGQKWQKVTMEEYRRESVLVKLGKNNYVICLMLGIFMGVFL